MLATKMSFPDSLFEILQSISPFSIPHSQEQSQNACLSFAALFFFFPSPRMPLERRCLVSAAVAAATIKISAISKYSLHCCRMKKGLLSRHIGALLVAEASGVPGLVLCPWQWPVERKNEKVWSGLACCLQPRAKLISNRSRWAQTPKHKF